MVLRTIPASLLYFLTSIYQCPDQVPAATITKAKVNQDKARREAGHLAICNEYNVSDRKISFQMKHLRRTHQVNMDERKDLTWQAAIRFSITFAPDTSICSFQREINITAYVTVGRGFQ